MKKLLMLTLIFGLSIPVFAGTAVTEKNEDDVQLIALRIYADWCGNCKRIDAKLDEIKAEFKDDAIWFTYFDVTDDFAHAQTSVLANRLGLSHIYEEYKDRTGILLLINPNTAEVIETVTSTIQTSVLKDKLIELGRG